MVHLGPGAFFRAFNAIYTHQVLQTLGGDWGITAVSLRSTTARDQMGPQGGVYTSVELGPEGVTSTVIDSISDVLVAPENPSAVVAVMADPATKIVSLTITEKGYCHNPADGTLNVDHPDIVHDLAHLDVPRSALGFLVAGLAKRFEAGDPPFTVLSCDNLPSNGKLTRGVVLEFAQKYDPSLAKYIAASVSFPSTMVDRITPATTQEDVAQLAARCGYNDPACVVHEPFRQWVIEDEFVAGRPAWDAVGAQFVKNVDAHELMKLRCLNGTHSTLAYLGYLAGYETISKAVADPRFAKMCKKIWQEEIIPTVPQPEGEDLSAYCAALLARYQNSSIKHRTWQIAMDGSQKLPQRLLGTVQDNLARGHVPKGLCLAVAAWMLYVGAVDEKGQEIDVRDPHAAHLKTVSEMAETDADKVKDLLSLSMIFDPDLAADIRFIGAVTDAYKSLRKLGAAGAVEMFVA